MIKFVMCLRRRPDLSREQFQDYWLNQHGQLFAKFADSYRTKRYIQDHTLDTPLNKAIQDSRGMAEPYDGVAVVWFESEEDLVEAMNSPEGQKLSALLLEDEANFVDHAHSTAFIAVEHEI